MAVLQATDISDLVASTINELGELKMTDIMSDYQNTIFLKRMVKKSKMTFNAGPEIEFRLITDDNGSCRAVGLYYTANVNPTNVMTTGKIPWRHVTWNWAIERREIAMNRSPRKIMDMIKERRIAAFASSVKFFERRAWRVPAVTDNENFYGMPYWIVKSNTANTTNDGLNGTLPSGYTTVANISPTTYPRWANYATQYTNISQADLIDKLWDASDVTDFMPIVDDIPTYNLGDDYGYYTTRSVRRGLKQILHTMNDDLGFDLDPTNGKLTFRRAPMTWVKELDADTTGPIYGINWGVFHVVGLRDEWMHETQIPVHETQPTVAATHTDCSFNTLCHDRRRNFVLATDTAMPA